jgi:glycosyltransferase involved in cell wall biosynthesis
MKAGGLRTQGVIRESTQERPLVSIITVVFNGEKSIENTIVSVIHQSYQNVEYIICDGCSTDSTVDIIQRYDSKIDYWISEPDLGIYDAMNKGISLSQGKWILFLGSDDHLMNDGSINDLVSHASEELMVIYGNVVYNNGYTYKSRLDLRTAISNTLHHQASLYNSNLFTNFRYDTACKVYSDYELNLLILIRGYQSYYVDRVISFCNTGGMTTKYKQIVNGELKYLRGKHIDKVSNLLISSLFWLWTTLAALKGKMMLIMINRAL